MIRLPRRKDLLNRCGRGTIPQTKSLEKTLPGRDRQIPATPGQEAFLTPYLTTVRTGTRGNSGFKSSQKYSIPSRKCRKALQITTKNLVQAVGSKMPGVRVSPLGPKEEAKKDIGQKSPVFSRLPRPVDQRIYGPHFFDISILDLRSGGTQTRILNEESATCFWPGSWMQDPGFSIL